MVGARVLISGRVQGVFFRFTMSREAEREGVNGWVKNRLDGRVEALLEGKKESVKRLISWCHKGPPGAAVHNVEVEWLPYQGMLDSFSIRGWE